MTKSVPTGSVMVVGAGIAGIQAALDLANSGYLVYLVEKDSAIGGVMSQLDKTFPTNDCSMCIISPKLVECGSHPNIELLTLSELKDLEGQVGNFKAKVIRYPRFTKNKAAEQYSLPPYSSFSIKSCRNQPFTEGS